MLKPGKHDVPVDVLIQGDELEQLQLQSHHLAETYGLDRRIINYRGTRPIRLYRWDLEWLIDVLTLLEEKRYRPHRLAARAALAALKTRLSREYALHFPEHVEPN
jgi:hypothetical protein